MPDNHPMLDAERREYAANVVVGDYVETPKERRYREALERLQAGCYFLHPSEVKRIVDEALSPG